MEGIVPTSVIDNTIATAQTKMHDQHLQETTSRFSKHLSNEKIKETAQKFETMFLSQMLTYMMPETDVNAPFNGGKGEEVFRSFMTNEYAEIMAKTGKTGIAEMVEREMIRMQEASQEF